MDENVRTIRKKGWLSECYTSLVLFIIHKNKEHVAKCYENRDILYSRT